MDFNEFMPFIVLWIPWLLAVKELRSHLRHGVMNEYLRRSSDPDNDQPGTRLTTPEEHPISYHLLLLFYASTAVAIPVVTAVVMYGR